MTKTFFRHQTDTDTDTTPLDRAKLANRCAVDCDGLRPVNKHLTGQDLHQLALAVAGDPCNAEHLASPDLQVYGP